MRKPIAAFFLLASVLLLVACSHRENVSYKDDVKKALEQADTAANTRIIANEISIQPVGSESEAKDVASNLDDAIEKNYKAALISSGLEKQHVRFKAKNGVLTLTGGVPNANQRQHAEKLREFPTYSK
jgi:hypothetical protein